MAEPRAGSVIADAAAGQAGVDIVIPALDEERALGAASGRWSPIWAGSPCRGFGR
ncbi:MULTISPECIES: hypothetical protein [unclassified Nonomuraea]|uniref:hypothetical protein n=1 Tax=unclassified Nonomuraea TaxID=2593643 RepID=UPI0035C1D645